MPPCFSWLALASIPQNLPAVERLSPKNRAGPHRGCFSSFPVIYHHQLRVPGMASPTLAPQRLIRKGTCGISLCLGEVKGQGLEVALEVWVQQSTRAMA